MKFIGYFGISYITNMAPQHPRAKRHDMWPACDRPPDEILAAQLCEALHDVFICTEKGAKMAMDSDKNGDL